jgi:hypothetical protein
MTPYAEAMLAKLEAADKAASAPRSNKVPDFDKTNSGVFFVNDRKQGAASPDFKGNCETACPSCGTVSKYWMSAWKKMAKGSGKQFLSVAFTADDANINEPVKSKPAKSGDFDFDDDIPF